MRSVSEYSSGLGPNLKTLDEIRAIKAAEKASEKQAHARAVNAMVRNAAWLVIGMGLGLGSLVLL